MSESDTKHKLHIEEAFLKGFKSIDNLHIKLNPGLNVIIGPNGSGKSNLLEFLNDAIYSMFRVLQYTFKSAELILKSTNSDNKFKISRQSDAYCRSKRKAKRSDEKT
ncbi:AAA family ATPase [Pedobacter sp. N23S346]|uniref:AAA family ATPase n=1 Tax=Pedobacter sp. N23S346 TaxID=3402750 RepID=UPI003AD03375